MTAEQALAIGKAKDPSATRFVVRLYDGFDNEWMDIDKPGDEEHVKRVWNDRTSDGTRATSYSDIDYYAIYPVTTTMAHSQKGNAELGIKTIR